MKHTKKKISKMVQEITTYLLLIGATDITVNIQDRDKDFRIFIESDFKENEEIVEQFVEKLKSPKQVEIEEYYWELTGDCDVDSELHLVGMMMDKAYVEVKEGRIEIELYRNKNS
jgi:uncharacterized tellurite resistance protein B-like protein